MFKCCNHLDSFSKTHFICQNAADPVIPMRQNPIDAIELVVAKHVAVFVSWLVTGSVRNKTISLHLQEYLFLHSEPSHRPLDRIGVVEFGRRRCEVLSKLLLLSLKVALLIFVHLSDKVVLWKWKRAENAFPGALALFQSVFLSRSDLCRLAIHMPLPVKLCCSPDLVSRSFPFHPHRVCKGSQRAVQLFGDVNMVLVSRLPSICIKINLNISSVRVEVLAHPWRW
mmetsp:Transcript_19048/g.31755  ORF Transcript_19048/g.31755 Transcript_19048/m.31755 type:complete len:226 (-) Transcript_19048:2228-2905(-)